MVGLKRTSRALSTLNIPVKARKEREEEKGKNGDDSLTIATEESVEKILDAFERGDENKTEFSIYLGIPNMGAVVTLSNKNSPWKEREEKDGKTEETEFI